MIYDYKCTSCSHIVPDVKQSVKDKPLVECPQCLQQTLERIIYGGINRTVEREPTTLKELAEKNTKNMGRYELQDREHADKVKSKEVRRHYEILGRMTPEQQQKYIEHG